MPSKRGRDRRGAGGAGGFDLTGTITKGNKSELVAAVDPNQGRVRMREKYEAGGGGARGGEG